MVFKVKKQQVNEHDEKNVVILNQLTCLAVWTTSCQWYGARKMLVLECLGRARVHVIGNEHENLLFVWDNLEHKEICARKRTGYKEKTSRARALE